MYLLDTYTSEEGWLLMAHLTCLGAMIPMSHRFIGLAELWLFNLQERRFVLKRSVQKTPTPSSEYIFLKGLGSRIYLVALKNTQDYTKIWVVVKVQLVLGGFNLYVIGTC